MRILTAIFATALTGLSVSACSPNKTQAVSVTPESVHTYAASCAVSPSAFAAAKNYTPIDLTPQGYVNAGLDYVDQECQTFFDSIIELQKEARFASSSLATANTQTAALLALVSSSAKSIAILAVGTETIRKMIDGYAAEYAFAPFAVESRKAVYDAMTEYRKSTDTVAVYDRLTAATGDNYCLAQNVVRNYAKICSVSGIEALARQAIAGATVTPSTPTGGTGTAGQGQGQLRPASGGAQRRMIGLGLPNFVANGARR